MTTATRLLALAALLLPSLATAQTRLTVREINRVPQANLDQLAALGANVTTANVDALIGSGYAHLNEQVEFTGVVLTNPFSSGNASPVGTAPGRVHVFLRDTSANSQGYAGMVAQVVGAPEILTVMRVGRVFTVQGQVQQFSNAIQITPAAVVDEGPYQNYNLPATILQPVLATPSDLNTCVTTGSGEATMVNWARFNEFNSQYLRFESVLITNNVVGSNQRVNFQWSAGGSCPEVNSGDISLRFRNDRAGSPGYPNPPYNTRPNNEPFVLPAIGSIVNVQGFAVMSTFNAFNDHVPPTRLFAVHPFEDADLQVLVSPPLVANVTGPTGVPGNGPLTVSAAVTPDPARSIQSVVANYTFSTGGSGQVTLTATGSGTYTGQIPAAPDGAFVSFSVVATDNTGASSTVAGPTFRVLYAGIDDIEDIQRTSNAAPGNSPFAGQTITTGMNVEAVVQAVFTTDANVRYAVLQDDAGLAPWSGIWAVLTESQALAAGDRITITGAEIRENFSVTELRNLVYTATGTGAPLGYKVVTTGFLNGDDPGAQEAHEGMLLRFENVVITDLNADGADDVPGNGEWRFSSNVTSFPIPNSIRADDLSNEIPLRFSLDNLAINQIRAFMQGAWYFSFNQYKLVPLTLADIGAVTGVGNEPVGPATGAFGLETARPNPVRSLATVRYAVATAGAVRLAVYDVTGREVATLVDGVLAPNTYEATLDVDGLAAGVYVVRLQSGADIATRRLTVVR